MASYFFQIHGMSPNPESDSRNDNRDRWLPPKRRGSNILHTMPGQTTPVNLTFQHDGNSTRLLYGQRLAEVRTRAMLYRTYSMYHARGVLWTVDYNATERKVGDGKHDEDEDDESSPESEEEDGEPYDDWAELSFGRANVEGHQSLSYAGRHLSERRLLAQRRDQPWLQHLIPDRYQSHITTRDRRSGGLVGELPILIGLVAMSLPISAWPTILPQTIVNPPDSPRSWRISQYQLDEIDRGTQWSEERGVIVKVFRDSQRTSEKDMKDYEHGSFGPILA